MTGIDTNAPINDAYAAPNMPNLLIKGKAVMESPAILTKVTNVIYSCFLIARKSAEVDPEIALTTPNTDKTFRAGIISSHFEPKNKKQEYITLVTFVSI